MLERYYRGYNFQSKQQCVRIDQKLKLGSLRDTRNIDAWLLDYFIIDAERISGAGDLLEDGQGALALAVIRRALALYGELGRACAIPCFDHGRAIHLEAAKDEPETYLAIVALPVIDNLPLPWFTVLFQDALNLVLNPLRLEPTPEAADALFAQLDRSIIAKLRKHISFAKSALPVCELAFRQNIPFRHLGNGVIRLGWGAKSQLLLCSSIERDSAIGAVICRDKHLAAQILRAAGLPTPEHFLANSRETAIKAARQLGWPVVVKPDNLEQSQGVTINIRTEAALLAAYDHARTKSEYILVERHVPGLCHRIMVAGGNVVYAVRRLPKGVRGNGRNTVTELVTMANAAQARMPPWKRLKEFPLDDLALKCLAHLGLAPHSIPRKGQWVSLRPVPSGEWGGEIEDLTSQIHPDNAQLALHAARAIGMTVAGIDLVTVDITKPWHENGAIIIEMNYQPEFATQGRESHAASLIPALVDGDGRIPVHLVTGEGDLFGKALELKKRLRKRGRKCHLTSSNHTEDSQGREIVMGFSTLFERSLALTMRPDVHELILVGQGPDLFNPGLAIDRLESAYIVDDNPARGEQTIEEIRARFPVQSCYKVTP